MHDVVVVGAGPSGLVTAKEMIERGFQDIVCLEKSDTIGGTFSNSYDGLKLTSSATFSMFSDFEVPRADHNQHWSKEEAVNYWRRYSEHFGVLPIVRYGIDVTRLEHSPDQTWKLHLSSGEAVSAKRVIFCTGTNTDIRLPDWVDAAQGVTVTHSRSYRSPNSCKAKNVLVIGGGESASDIAYEVSKVARRVTVSLRNGTGWVTPRARNDVAADNSTNRFFWSLPRDLGPAVSKDILEFEKDQNDPLNTAIHQLNQLVPSSLGIFGSYGTKTLALPLAMVENQTQIVQGVNQVREGGREIEFECGTVLKDIDEIICCTGFVNKVPFLPEEHAVETPRDLYKHVFHPDIGSSLAFVGFARPGFGAQFPIVEMQARWVGHVFAGDCDLPTGRSMKSVAAADASVYQDQFGTTGKRITALVDFHRYMDDIGNLIKCVPPLSRLFFQSPRVWKHIMFGPTQGTQFRLVGLGAKPKLARSILLSLPVSRLNHIVKIAFRRRLLRALRIGKASFLNHDDVPTKNSSQEV